MSMHCIAQIHRLIIKYVSFKRIVNKNPSQIYEQLDSPVDGSDADKMVLKIKNTNDMECHW